MCALVYAKEILEMEKPAGEVILTPNLEEIPEFQENWEKASRDAPFHTLGLEDYSRIPVNDGVYRRLCLHQKFEIGRDLILPCVGITRKHRFAIGARRLFTMKASAINLLNYWVLEDHSPSDIANAIKATLKLSGADIFTMSEVPVASALHGAAGKFSWPLATLSIYRKPTQHWLTDLPDDFETYVSSLSRRTRKGVRRHMRILEEEFDVRLETLTRPDQVDRFLNEAERINRLTYQWDLGERVQNNTETRDHFMKLATEGRLRSSLLLLNGKAVAFERGQVDGRFYSGEAACYDPEYASYGVGIMLMMYIKRDLIENTGYRTYDFGMGGDESGYKSSYGNRNVTCNSYYILRLDRPRGLVIWALQNTLNAVKSAASWLIGSTDLDGLIKRVLRKS